MRHKLEQRYACARRPSSETTRNATAEPAGDDNRGPRVDRAARRFQRLDIALSTLSETRINARLRELH
jgi:hypothetical protein